MKKSVKICLIVGIALILLGVGTVGSSIAMGGKAILNGRYDLWSMVADIGDQGNLDLSAGKTYTFTDVNKLEIDVDEGIVEFLEVEEGTQGDSITVYADAPYGKLDVEQSGSTLGIQVDRARRRWFFSVIGEESRVSILIPKGYRFREVSLDSGASLFIVKSLRSDELEVVTRVGSVHIENSEVRTLDAECGVGEINYQGSILGDVSLEIGVGNIDLSVYGEEEAYNYQLSCGIGNIELGDSSYSGLSDDKRIDHGAARNMDLECGIGSIQVKFLKQQ